MKNKKNIDIYYCYLNDEVKFEDENEDLDFEWLSMNADNISYFSNINITEKFEKSFFGKFFKEEFFEKEKTKTHFEKSTYSYSFLKNINFKYNDVYESENNDIYNFIKKFKSLKSIKNLSFNLSIDSRDTDMIKFDSFKITADIISFGKKSNIKFFDMTCYEKFVVDLKKSMEIYNYDFKSIESMVNYYIYEDHPLVKKYNINLFNHIESMNAINKLIEDLENIKLIENY